MAERLRVALIAGGLGLGGAEKQLVYLARSLLTLGVDLRIYCITRGEHFEEQLSSLGLTPTWIGRFSNPLVRAIHLAALLREFRPHILQSAHFFTNLYAVIASRLLGSISIGAVRSDIAYEVEGNGVWGPWLLRTPSALLANSHAAQCNAGQWGIPSAKIHVLPNVIDLRDFDRQALAVRLSLAAPHEVLVFAVGSLLPVKRLDRFLKALALARQETAHIHGVIIGDGPEKANLQACARSLGLLPNGVCFYGSSKEVPSLLKIADLLALTSDNEGFPNVLIEAMAAGLPVITTPAGDAGSIVQDRVTGYVVPFDDLQSMAGHLVNLARSPDVRQRLGEAGRRRVELQYSIESLPARLLAAYTQIAQQKDDQRLLQVLRVTYAQA